MFHGTAGRHSNPNGSERAILSPRAADGYSSDFNRKLAGRPESAESTSASRAHRVNDPHDCAAGHGQAAAAMAAMAEFCLFTLTAFRRALRSAAAPFNPDPTQVWTISSQRSNLDKQFPSASSAAMPASGPEEPGSTQGPWARGPGSVAL